MAADDEVLEAQSAPRSVQLVGSDGLARGLGFMWLYRLRKLNGPNFTWPLMMFAGVAPETILQAHGQDSRRQAISDENPQGTDCLIAAKLSEAFALR